MKAYTLLSGAGAAGLSLVDRPPSGLGQHDVRVGLKAAALNNRDLQFARGSYHKPDRALVPLVDGVGSVMEIGSAVTRFRPGDRVTTTYWPRWIDGAISAAKTAISYGVQIDGTLAEELVAHEEGLVRAPEGLSDAQAATIPCAGATAWNALFVQGGAKPGATVLILGTGGVAVWALQIATAAGLNPIVTSSSDDKLARAERLGARAVVNYRMKPDWQDEVLRLTGGQGVDVVIEVGGEGTLARSIAVTRYGGSVVVIGALSGAGGAPLPPHSLILGAKRLAGVMVGSRQTTEDLVRFVELHRIEPVIDREFAFADAPAAYERMAAGRSFGKTVIAVT